MSNDAATVSRIKTSAQAFNFTSITPVIHFKNRTMATKHKVSCINKKGNHYNAHERISNIGGINPNNTQWTLTLDEAIKAIEDKKYEFYVSVGGNTVNIMVAKYQERKYLKTEKDGYSPDNLLSLPECPA